MLWEPYLCFVSYINNFTSTNRRPKHYFCLLSRFFKFFCCWQYTWKMNHEINNKITTFHNKWVIASRPFVYRATGPWSLSHCVDIHPLSVSHLFTQMESWDFNFMAINFIFVIWIVPKLWAICSQTSITWSTLHISWVHFF